MTAVEAAVQTFSTFLIALGLSSAVAGCVLGAIWAARIKDKDDDNG